MSKSSPVALVADPAPVVRCGTADRVKTSPHWAAFAPTPPLGHGWLRAPRGVRGSAAGTLQYDSLGGGAGVESAGLRIWSAYWNPVVHGGGSTPSLNHMLAAGLASSRRSAGIAASRLISVGGSTVKMCSMFGR